MLCIEPCCQVMKKDHLEKEKEKPKADQKWGWAQEKDSSLRIS